MWVQLVVVSIQLTLEVINLIVGAKAKADAAQQKFDLDQETLKAIYAQAWENLRAKGKLDSLKAKLAWDKADKDNTPPTG